tara:strand:- start:2134 stop:2469 length:336 start_codon:yes stop_codon:yes gene_type:complete
MKYSEMESGNVGLGQLGSVFSNTTDNLTPVNGVFVAITVIADAKFTVLQPEGGDGVKFASTTVASTSGAGDGNEAIATGVSSGTEFPQGITIFGRYKSITLAEGSIIAYIG